jgi:hypothetical protein
VFLEITREGKTSIGIVAQRVTIHRLALVHFNDWLLVTSGKYVLGGYDYNTRQIVAVDSGALPFTQRTLSGEEVANVTLDEGEDVAPPGWVDRPDR